jgi:hypothetical protein
MLLEARVKSSAKKARAEILGVLFQDPGGEGYGLGEVAGLRCLKGLIEVGGGLSRDLAQERGKGEERSGEDKEGAHRSV